MTSRTDFLIALLPPAVHNEELWPEPGWLHFTRGIWGNSSQLPFLLLHSRNWQVRKQKHVKGFSKCNRWNTNHITCWTVSNRLNPCYSFRVVLWKCLSTGRDKSAVKKSPLTSLGECRYVPNWATTSMTHIISMRPRIKGQRFVTHVEALWVSLFGVDITAQLYCSITCIVYVLLQLWGVIKQGFHCKGKAHISRDFIPNLI